MKAFIALVAIIGAAHAGHVGGSAGTSVSSRSEDGLGNYKFNYNEQHSTGGSWRSEAGNKHSVVGSFGLNDVDGRVRVVNYVADKLGFRASIKSNEPGTESVPAASTHVLGSTNSVVAGSVQTAKIDVPVAVQVPVVQKSISSVPVQVPVPVVTKSVVATPVSHGSIDLGHGGWANGGWAAHGGWANGAHGGWANGVHGW